MCSLNHEGSACGQHAFKYLVAPHLDKLYAAAMVGVLFATKLAVLPRSVPNQKLRDENDVGERAVAATTVIHCTWSVRVLTIHKLGIIFTTWSLRSEQKLHENHAYKIPELVRRQNVPSSLPACHLRSLVRCDGDQQLQLLADVLV